MSRIHYIIYLNLLSNKFETEFRNNQISFDLGVVNGNSSKEAISNFLRDYKSGKITYHSPKYNMLIDGIIEDNYPEVLI